MARRLLWLVVPGIVTVFGGTALAISMTGDEIASDIKVRAASVLADPKLAWASVDVDMRDASIVGTATDQRVIDEAVRRVAAIDGVRSVASKVVLAEHVSPFPFTASVRDGVVRLSGGVPDELARTQLIAELSSTTNDLRLMSGAPDRDAFVTAARYALDYLKKFDQGDVTLEDLDLTVVGRAANHDEFAALSDLRRKGPPEGVRLLRADIKPPLAEPYELFARFEAEQLTLSGSVPDLRNADLVANAAGAIPVRSELHLASGAPSGFSDKAKFLIENLVLLERGEARLTGDTLTLTGAPADAQTAERIRVAASPRGVAVTLEPPRVADFRLVIEKSISRSTVTGHVPDAASRTRLEPLLGPEAARVDLARGAPETFAPAFEFALAAMPRLAEGRFAFAADSVSLSGRASSLADYEAIEKLVADIQAAGLAIDVTDLKLPLATPFIWSADKAADGDVTLSGFVPNTVIRERIAAATPRLVGDVSARADGAPADFESSALAGLEVLALLDSGRLAFDGARWSLTGAAMTPLQDFRVRDQFAALGLSPADWALTINLPSTARAAALPVIEPYTWRVQKSADGRVSFAGFAPSEAFQRFMRQRAGGTVSDASVLGAGAPADFPAEAAAGLEALLLLDEGSLGLSAGKWTLSGRTATGATRDRARALVGEAGDWQLAIDALDVPPVADPFVFTAEKTDNGVTLTGHLTSAELQQMVRAKASPLATDNTELASGEPAGFTAELLAGLDALGTLREGRLAFDGTGWSLVGTAASETARIAADAALDTAPHRAAGWTRDVRGPVVAAIEPQVVAPAEPAPQAIPDAQSAAPPELPDAQQSDVAVDAVPASSEPPASPPQPEAAPAPAVDVAALAQPAAVPPPVAETMPSRLLFEASRGADGEIRLAGLVPDESVRVALAGRAPAEGLGLGQGLPADFLGSAEVGLSALESLSEGRMGYGEGVWMMQGEAPTASDRYAILAALGTAPGGPWRTDIDVMPPERFCALRLANFAGRNPILFRSGSDVIADESLPAIEELAGYLRQCPETSVYVEGHTDSDGAEQLNLALSVSRAEAVVFALIDRGIAFERLYAVGYGASLPIADNATAAGKQRNRRIAFQIAENR